MRELLTGEAAALLGVAPQTVRTLAPSGDLPCGLTAGGHRRFLEGDVLAFRGRSSVAAPDATRASVWAAPAVEVPRAAEADLGGTDAGRAFHAAAAALVSHLRHEARAAAPSRPRA